MEWRSYGSAQSTSISTAICTDTVCNKDIKEDEEREDSGRARLRQCERNSINTSNNRVS